MTTSHSMEASKVTYQPGDLAWCKLGGHPWWPAMVCASPQTQQYEKEDKRGSQVHMLFFSSPPTRAWMKIKQIRPFIGKNDPECRNGGLYYNTKKTFRTALLQAETAQFMTLEERLHKILGTSKVIPSTSIAADSECMPAKKGRKRKAPKGSASSVTKKYRMGPKSLTRRRPSMEEPETFILGKTPIPRYWLTPYVLMNTNDIPGNLTVNQYINLGSGDKSDTPESTSVDSQQEVPSVSRQIETETQSCSGQPKNVTTQPETSSGVKKPNETKSVTKQTEKTSISHDSILAKDAKKGKKSVSKADDNESDIDEETSDLDFLPEDTDEDILADSDDDPGWSPSGKNIIKPFDFPKKTKKTGKHTKLKKPGKKKKDKDIPPTKPSMTVTTTKPTAAPAVQSQPKPSPPKPSPANPPDAPRSEKVKPSDGNIIITDNTPTGYQPEAGDFLIEKEVCKKGKIPFLWRYKKGGLIQKYERVVGDDGKAYYENILSFSDWWACYAHRYQRVKCRLKSRSKNVERFLLIEESLEEEEQKEDSDVITIQDDSSSEETNNKTQEQEVSSTTSEMEFTVGQFVIDIKDKRNVDNFPIWKIESDILLMKYEPVFRSGKMLHKPLKTYRGYRDISKSYETVKVQTHTEDLVEVTEDSKPKIYVNAGMEDEYDKNPLLRHFYVYLQVILSQALEPGFIAAIKKTKDPTYTLPLGEVDKIIRQKCTHIERKIRWTQKIQTALKTMPYLREVEKKEESRKCEGLANCKESVEETIFLFGPQYDPDSLQQKQSTTNNLEFRIGKTAMEHISPYHQLCHFKLNLYDRCKSKIKLIRDSQSKKDLDVREIMDQCLGNKYWVLQSFEDYLKLVDLPYH